MGTLKEFRNTLSEAQRARKFIEPHTAMKILRNHGATSVNYNDKIISYSHKKSNRTVRLTGRVGDYVDHAVLKKHLAKMTA